ncbi:TPA: hypothetical protein ACXL4G_005860 [Klebsiella michiganensis]
MTSKLTITDERLAELVAFKPLPGTDINSATRDEWMAMAAELHERRKVAMDSEPVAWLWSRDGDAERDVSLTPPDDDDDAAMLNHPSSIQPNTDAAPSAEIKHPSSNSPVIGIDLASGPDRTVEVRYVAPPGYVMVPKEPTETMINAWLSEVANWRGHVAGYKAMLAVAPQEVK